MLEHHYAAPAAAPSAAQSIELSWLRPVGIVWLSIYNFLLRILTLGIHHFWGKTEVRKRIWSSTRINGEPLEYTGTGGELFTGFLIIFAVILLPVMLLSFALVALLGPESKFITVFQVSLYAFFIFLTGIAIYRAQRYRLNRTRWRGIRAGLVGEPMRYGWTYFWTLLLMPFTLGWISPWRATRLQKIITDDMRYGDQPFHFSGSSGPLYKSYAVFWLLTALVLLGVGAIIGGAVLQMVDFTGGSMGANLSGEEIVYIAALIYGGIFVAGFLYMILSAWYRAAMMRHFASHTHLGGITLRSTVKARSLLWISFTNYLLLFLTAILATAVVAFLGTMLFAGLASSGIDPLGLQSGQKALVAQRIAGPLTFIFLFSLGMLLPYTQSRTTGYLVRNMHFDGTIDLAAVSAGAQQQISRGEGLAQAFDIDAL